MPDFIYPYPDAHGDFLAYEPHPGGWLVGIQERLGIYPCESTPTVGEVCGAVRAHEPNLPCVRRPHEGLSHRDVHNVTWVQVDLPKVENAHG